MCCEVLKSESFSFKNGLYHTGGETCKEDWLVMLRC